MSNQWHRDDEPDEPSWASDGSIDEDELIELLDDYPRLNLVRPFIQTARHCRWFTALGTPPTKPVRAAARLYLDGLGFPEAELGTLATWDDAAFAAHSLDQDTAAWEAEEQLRAALTAEAIDTLGEDTVELVLTMIAAEVSPAVQTASETAAELWEVGDENLIQAAAGSAVQASHLAGLSLLAADLEETETHPFAAKFALFEAGHWPIGIAGTTLNLF